MGENSKSTQTLEELTVCVGDGNLLTMDTLKHI